LPRPTCSSRRSFDIRRANPFGALWALSRNPVVLWLLLALGFFTLASQAFPSVWNFFTIEVLQFSSSQIGIALGAFGVGFAVSQAFLLGPVIRRVGEWVTVLLGMAAASVALVGTAFIHTQVGLYGFLMVGSLAGLAGPAINSLMSRQVSDNAQGELQGAINATNSLTAIIGPVLATQLFNFFTNAPRTSTMYFPGAPFVGAGVLVVLACGIFVYAAWRYDLMHRPSVSKGSYHPDLAPPGQMATPPHDGDEDETVGPRVHP
jgi:DHA1 family tetracycline resistance protein-like MFS transporter